jgi:hypothetical protein
MIPVEGERHELNQLAELSVELHPAQGGSTVPTVLLGGVRFSAYVDSDGVVRFSIATDEGDLDPRIRIGRGEEDAVAMTITVNDVQVYVS